MKIVQINLNKSRGAQDLIVQYMLESRMEVALVSEPNRIPRGNWLGDAYGLAAVYWSTDEPCSLSRRGSGYVFVKYKGYILGSCYFSPNANISDFRELLGNIEIVVAGMGRQKIIIGGNFNARARGWDRICNERGYILEEWATDREMIIMNEGRKSTCIRAQGSSVVDITMGTEMAVRGVSSWEVDEYTETLSDHRYIKIDVKESKDENLYRKRIFPKWNIKRLEEDWFNTSVSCGEWLNR